MATLYVSDLDGTLLRSDERTSDFTNRTVNELAEGGILFTYATARSYITTRKVTRGLDARIPLIVYNGAFIMDNVSGEIIMSNYFGEDVRKVLDSIIARGVYPIVYSFIPEDSGDKIFCPAESPDGRAEKFSFVRDRLSRGTKVFVDSRKGDRRTNPVDSVDELYRGDIFYITCIDDKEKLEPLYELYREKYHCVFQRDIYSGEQWLEIMPQAASKANAVLQLKERLGCGRVVAFGDALNDIDMFEVADEAYAVENAAKELKAAADGVIGSNDSDGVAHFLRERFSADLADRGIIL